MNWLIASPVLVPLATSMATALLVNQRRAQQIVSLLGAAALLAVGCALVLAVNDGAVLRSAFGNWPEPFAIAFHIDRLSAVLILLTGLMALASLIFAQSDADPGRDQPLKEGALWVALPELEEDEGDPILDYAAIPRGDRDDAIKELVAQMVEQDPSLAPIVTKNALDIIITFEGSAASVEAGCAVAYAVAAAAESGVLLLDGPDEGEFEEDGEDDEEQEGAEDEGGETVWFPDAESFADFVFNEDDEEE